MRKDKPSRTALKVAMNLLTLAATPGMDQILPIGLIEATEKLLVACGFENSQSAGQEVYLGKIIIRYWTGS